MRRARALLANLSIAGVALLAMLALLEACFRFFPGLLPSGFYGSSRYREDLLTNVHGSRVVYNKVRRTIRHPNSEGFLDVEWDRTKPSGTLRLGFFGDSYVEAAQVPLEDTFYRRLQRLLGDRGGETLAFGISGWGTLHAAKASSVLSRRYDLDVVVYVFVENDLGDNAYEIQAARGGRLTPKAYAIASDIPPGYTVQWVRAPDDRSVGYRLGKALQNELIVVQLLWNRIQLLRGQGIQIRSDREAASMTERAGRIPNQNDLPSSWPPRYSRIARELGERILRDWKREVAAQGREFAILYVPRGESQLSGEVPIEDTWLPWLRETANSLAIPLVDPTPALAANTRPGQPMYDDHWSPAGHEVIARVLEEWRMRMLDADRRSR